MFSFSNLCLMLAASSITLSSAIPTKAAPHKASLEDVTTTPTIIPRQSVGEINDVIELAETVVSSIWDFITDIDDAQHEAEAAFTQNLINELASSYPTWNAMVCHDCSWAINDAYTTHYELDIGLGFTQGYDILIFDNGEVDNLGDGGYINWCMYGSFASSGSDVTFYSMNN